MEQSHISAEKEPSTKTIGFYRAQKALLKAWLEYSKPMTGKKLSRRIGIEEVRQAMSIEPELKAFLQTIGLV